MQLEAYFSVLEESEPHEMTVLAILNDPEGLPDGNYAFLEKYCPSPDCDCREVYIDVIIGIFVPDGRLSLDDYPLARLCYRWEKSEFYHDNTNAETPIRDFPGAYLDPSCKQSEHAQTLLGVFRDSIAEDDALSLRFEEHYYNLKFKMKEKALAERKEIPLGLIDSSPYFAPALPSFRKKRMKLR